MSFVQRRGWRYFATRLNGNGTETLLDPELPLEGVTIDEVLSGDASISGSIDPVYRRLLGPDGLPILREWSTAIYAEADGVIRAGAILVNSEISGSSWNLEAVGFTGYGRDLPYTGPGYLGVEVDPMDCARLIWQHIQSQGGGNIGLELDDTDTGGKVSIGTELRQVEFDSQSGPVSFEAGPWKLAWYTDHDLQGEMDDLAEETPFDYLEHHEWRADGTIKHFLEMGYPRIGRRREDLRFVYGVNIFDPVESNRSGETYASGTMVLGAGEGAGMVRSLKEPTPRPEGRLRRIAVVTDDKIRSRKRADQRADRENAWRRAMDDIESVVVHDHPNARLGEARPGDEIRLEGRGDWIDIDLWVRILSISYQPENGKVASYTVARTDKLDS